MLGTAAHRPTRGSSRSTEDCNNILLYSVVLSIYDHNLDTTW